MLRFGLVLVPEYALLVFGVGVLLGWLFPVGPGDGLPVLVAVPAAVAAVLVVIPTGGEIPVLLGLTAAGAPPVVVGTLLVTLPALSLPSMLMVGRALGRRAALAASGTVAGAGLLAGGLLTVL